MHIQFRVFRSLVRVCKENRWSKTLSTMSSNSLEKLTVSDFKWLNEPKTWTVKDNTLEFTTEKSSSFWQKTYFDFQHNSGHLFGVDIKDDFTLTACIEANVEKFYDQAGLMIYVDENHWLEAGMEYNDGQPMICSIYTNGMSDWATGIFPGDPSKFLIRLSKVKEAVCVKFSTDNRNWNLLRLAPFPKSDNYFVGLAACTPLRKGMSVKFSEVSFTKPVDDILHAN